MEKARRFDLCAFSAMVEVVEIGGGLVIEPWRRGAQLL